MDYRDTSKLQPSQIEEYVDKLECISLEEMLTSRWVACGCGAVRLGVEAAVQAGRGGPETVHLTIITKEKSMAVVWLLLSCELWRIHLLPLLLPDLHTDHHHRNHDKDHKENQQVQDENQKQEDEDQDVNENEERGTATSSLPFIMVMQTEAASLGLLEGLVYDEDSAASLDGLLLDLVDYCVRQLVPLAALPTTPLCRMLKYLRSRCPCTASLTNKFRTLGASYPLTLAAVTKSHHTKPYHTTVSHHATQNHTTPHHTTPRGGDGDGGGGTTVVEEVLREECRVVLVVGCRAVSVLHLLASCRNKLPLCVTTRLLGTHDVPQLMAQLVERAPWRGERGGQQCVFEDGEWRRMGDVGPPLCRTECQAWAALAYLLLDPEALAGYDVNSVRRAALLRLRSRLHPAVLAQVPALEPLARWLANLAIAPPQPARPPPLVTTLTQVSEAVGAVWEGRWQELAGMVRSRFLRPDHAALRGLAVGLSAAWDLDALEQLLPDPPTCGVCGSPAGRRCSRCRSQWYCRRECQVQDWKKHQRICYIIRPSSPTS